MFSYSTLTPHNTITTHIHTQPAITYKAAILCVMKGWHSSVGIATRYRLDGPGIESRVAARFSAPVQTGPGAYQVSYTISTGSFPGVKRPGRGADHPPPSKCRGYESVGLYLYSASGSSWPVIGRSFTFTVCIDVREILDIMLSNILRKINLRRKWEI